MMDWEAIRSVVIAKCCKEVQGFLTDEKLVRSSLNNKKAQDCFDS